MGMSIYGGMELFALTLLGKKELKLREKATVATKIAAKDSSRADRVSMVARRVVIHTAQDTRTVVNGNCGSTISIGTPMAN